MTVIVTVISLILDGILSKYISLNSIFLPLFTIMSFILIYPFFNNEYRYLKYIAIIGLLYDIAYMNTILYSSFIFVILGVIILFYFYFFSYNVKSIFLVSLITIVFYRFINYFLLFLFHLKNFSFSILFKSIYSSLLLNILYCTLFYLIIDYINKKRRKINKSKNYII